MENGNAGEEERGGGITHASLSDPVDSAFPLLWERMRAGKKENLVVIEQPLPFSSAGRTLSSTVL